MRMCPLPVPILCAILIGNLHKLVQFQWVRCVEGNTRHLHQIAKVKSLFLQAFFVSGLPLLLKMSTRCHLRPVIIPPPDFASFPQVF